jgi:hypothetical protein
MRQGLGCSYQRMIAPLSPEVHSLFYELSEANQTRSDRRRR